MGESDKSKGQEGQQGPSNGSNSSESRRDTHSTNIMSGFGQRFDPKRWQAKDSGRPPSPDEYFTPGKNILEGLCEVVEKIGSGGMCDVYKVETDLWEVMRYLMLQGDVKQVCEEIGIKKDDVLEGIGPTEEQAAEVDKRLDGWKKIAAEAGMGFPEVVLRFLHPKLGTAGKAALKVIRPETTEGEEGSNNLKRFDQEAYVMKYDLDCKSIVKVFLQFQAGGYYCILEELVDGVESLDKVLKRGTPLSNEDAYLIGSQVFEGECHSHDKGIIWRDCAPKNILVTYDPETKKVKEVRATDWGIAKKKTRRGIERFAQGSTTSRDLSLTVTGKIAATPGHASPEQLRDSKTVDTPTDFFALGITLYEITAKEEPFQGREAIDVMQKILSNDPDDNPRLPNQVIARKRETIRRNMEVTKGFVDEESLPRQVSEEFEDLIMMLLEKDEARRIRRDYIAELFDKIGSKGLYDKREVSPEKAKEKDGEISRIMREIEQMGGKIKDAKEDERIREKLTVAGLYERAAHLTPRILKDGTIPDFSREDAFEKASEYYGKILEHYDPTAIALLISQEDIENILHRLEAHYRLEQLRVDQLALEKQSEKTSYGVRPKPVLLDKKGKEPKEPNAFLSFLALGFPGRSYRKLVKKWEEDVDKWKQEVDDTAVSIIESAKSFVHKGKYIAARKKLEQAKAFSEENEISSQTYQKMLAFEKYLEYEKNQTTLAASVESWMEVIRKSIARKRFEQTVDIIARIRREEVEKLDKKYAPLQQGFEELAVLNRATEEEYKKFGDIAKRMHLLRQRYEQFESELDASGFFKRSELERTKSDLERMVGECEGIDANLISAEDYAELSKLIEKLQGTKKKEGATEKIAKKLARSTYGWADEQAARLEEITGSIDKYSKDRSPKIEEARGIVAALDGETGVKNIEVGEGYVSEDKLSSLQERIGEQKKKLSEVSEEVGQFESLLADSESQDDNVKVKACAELILAYMRERGDLVTGLTYFERMPASRREPDMGVFFEAYKRTEDSRSFIRRTKDGLNDTLVERLRTAKRDYSVSSSIRSDEMFDLRLKSLCKYVDPELEIFKVIVKTRENIDRLAKDIEAAEEEAKQEQGKEPGKAEEEAKQEQGKEPGKAEGQQAYEAGVEAEPKKPGVRELKNTRYTMLPEFNMAVEQLIEIAEEKLSREKPQPRDPQDYLTVASYLEKANPQLEPAKKAAQLNLAANYYDKYVKLLPEGHPEAEDLTKRIEELRAKAAQ